jgi:hypothetical protein
MRPLGRPSRRSRSWTDRFARSGLLDQRWAIEAVGNPTWHDSCASMSPGHADASQVSALGLRRSLAEREPPHPASTPILTGTMERLPPRCHLGIDLATAT